MNQIIKDYSMSWKDILYIAFGSFMVALSFQVFFLPNNIISGGVASLSIIINDVTGWAPANIQYAINIPLLILSFIILGKEVTFKSLLGSLLFPFFTSMISDLGAWTTDPLLSSLFGGLMTGMGIGLVYKAKGTTGGTSIIAQIMSEYSSLTLGTATGLADGIIIIAGLFIFDLEAILYGILSVIVISRAIDIVLVGNSTQKNVLIISDETDAIRTEIIEKFDRGITLLDVRGGYRNEPKEMAMVVIEEREITALREMITQHDDDAFVVVMSASEVLGRGFSLEKYFPTG